MADYGEKVYNLRKGRMSDPYVVALCLVNWSSHEYQLRAGYMLIIGAGQSSSQRFQIRNGCMCRVDLLPKAAEPKTWRSRVHVILRPVNARARYGASYGLFRIVIISQNCCASHDMCSPQVSFLCRCDRYLTSIRSDRLYIMNVPPNLAGSCIHNDATVHRSVSLRTASPHKL